MSDKCCYLVEFDYKADQEDELSIVKGELLYDAEPEEDGWLRGRNSAGRRGLFPDNFVKPCRLATLRRVDPKLRASGLEANSAVYAIEPLPAAGSAAVATVYVPKLAAKFPVPLAYLDIDGGGGQPPHEQQQLPPRPLPGMAPTSAVRQHQPKPAQSATAGGSASASLSDKAKLQMHSDYVKVIHAYTAQHQDELTLHIGDVIRVTNRNLSDDGWWQGELHGQVGVFPDNFVEPCSASAAAPARQAASSTAAAAPARPPVSAAARHQNSSGGLDSAAAHAGSNGLLAGDHPQRQPLADAAAGRPRPVAGKRPPNGANHRGPHLEEETSRTESSQLTTAATSYSAAGGSGQQQPETLAELLQEVQRLRSEAAQRDREILELSRFKRTAVDNIAGLKEEIDNIKKSFHACCVDMDRVKRELASLSSI
ncbi:hypothetical protein BOX15_Mlig002072g2 [Macrostomum lignano]|uniref:SH3 domain-containing protein n=1 Tax=Macrostomum lignano TaxID=282301 RepID=A0A267F1E9_9PLAT|nr:hypothetical protein BOX15_Mlig002072g2 [Macrostomum lignano]